MTETEDTIPKIFNFDAEQVAPQRATGRGRKPKLAFKQDDIAGLFGMVNMTIILTGNQEYMLSKEEIDALSESWYNVLKHYPGASKWLTDSDKIVCWVLALGTSASVVGKRYAIYNLKNKTKKTQFTESGVPAEAVPDEPGNNGSYGSNVETTEALFPVSN